MNKILVLTGCAALVCAPTLAEDEDSAKSEEALPVIKATPKTSAIFTTLPLCRTVSGVAEVRKPGANAFVPAEAGKFYPLGSSFRTSGMGAMTVLFGKECSAKISGEAGFSTRSQALGINSRTVVLDHGTLELNLARNLPEGAFVVTSPAFMVKNLAGESKFVYTPMGDGDEATVRCVTGTMAVDGKNFKIAQMRAADEFRFRCSHDYLETMLYGTSGDYVVTIDRGVAPKINIDDEGKATETSVAQTLEWHLSPQTKVHIHRAVPAIGARMSVAVMTFDAQGEMKNNFAFSEGRAEVNSGELVAKPVADKEEATKKAASATTEEEADDEDEKKSDDSEEKKDDEKKDEAE